MNAVPSLWHRAPGRFAAAGLCATICGCNLAPHYDPPMTSPPPAFKEAVPAAAGNPGWKPATPGDSSLRGKWWEMYQDKDLDALEERVAVSNQTVAAAEANYRAALALVAQARAGYFPTLTLDPSVTRTRSSASVATVGSSSSIVGATSGQSGVLQSGSTTTGTTTGTGTSTTATTGTTLGAATERTVYALPLEVSYQVDFWGRVRNSVAQNRYSAEASAAQVATALLSTQSQLAQDYFQLRVADEQRRILDATLTDYRNSLQLVRTLFDNGLASEQDLAQADTQLDTAEAQATDVGIARAQYEHAIAVLIGVPPAAFSLAARRFDQALPGVPVGVPSDLLERRPDIAAAERQVAASNAAIGIARAAYFPDLTLGGSAGYESTAVGQLFSWPNRFWSFGPQLAQTLFDGGALRAATAQARAQNEQAAANYRQTVLAAFQSVEDNLASLRILSEELVQQKKATAAAQRTVDLSLDLYRNGVDSYVNVITAQNTLLSNRETELQLVLRQLTASVNLVNNLGGGWSRSAQPPGGAGTSSAAGAAGAAAP